MKVARLSDGSELHFPPETEDDVVDRTVREHLVNVEKERASSDVAPAIRGAGEAHAVQMQKLTETLAPLAETLTPLNSTADSVKGIEQAITRLSKVLEAYSSSVTSVAEAINAFSGVFEQGLKSAINTPRVINKDSHGNPYSIGPERDV